MKHFLLALLFISSYGCGNKGLSIISESGEEFVNMEQYENIIEDSIEKVIKRNPNLSSRELFLEHITLGLSLDFRVGFLKWNKSISNSIELHMLQDTENN